MASTLTRADRGGNGGQSGCLRSPVAGYPPVGSWRPQLPRLWSQRYRLAYAAVDWNGKSPLASVFCMQGTTAEPTKSLALRYWLAKPLIFIGKQDRMEPSAI